MFGFSSFSETAFSEGSGDELTGVYGSATFDVELDILGEGEEGSPGDGAFDFELTVDGIGFLTVEGDAALTFEVDIAGLGYVPVTADGSFTFDVDIVSDGTFFAANPGLSAFTFDLTPSGIGGYGSSGLGSFSLPLTMLGLGSIDPSPLVGSFTLDLDFSAEGSAYYPIHVEPVTESIIEIWSGVIDFTFQLPEELPLGWRLDVTKSVYRWSSDTILGEYSFVPLVIDDEVQIEIPVDFNYVADTRYNVLTQMNEAGVPDISGQITTSLYPFSMKYVYQVKAYDENNVLAGSLSKEIYPINPSQWTTAGCIKCDEFWLKHPYSDNVLWFRPGYDDPGFFYNWNVVYTSSWYMKTGLQYVTLETSPSNGEIPNLSSYTLKRMTVYRSVVTGDIIPDLLEDNLDKTNPLFSHSETGFVTSPTLVPSADPSSNSWVLTPNFDGSNLELTIETPAEKGTLNWPVTYFQNFNSRTSLGFSSSPYFNVTTSYDLEGS